MTFLLSSMVWIPALAAIGLLFFPARMDAFSRRIIGWQTADHLRTDLPLGCPRDGPVEP